MLTICSFVLLSVIILFVNCLKLNPKQLARNVNVVANIKYLSEKGLGVAQHGSSKLLIPNTLPGDEALVKITKTTNEVSYGKLIKLINVSKQRVGPPCSIADRCGGCQLQHQSYVDQLIFKKSIIEWALESQPSTSGIVRFIRNVSPSSLRLNYRNRVQFSVQRDVDKKIVVGLYASHSNRVVDAKYCAVQHNLVNEVLKDFRSFLFSYPVSVYDDSTGQGSIRHIVIRIGFSTNEVMVCLVSATKSVKYISNFIDCMSKLKFVKSILLHHNKQPGDQVIINDDNDRDFDARHKDSTSLLYGRSYIMDEILGIKVQVSLKSFTQSNPTQTVILYKTVLECIAMAAVTTATTGNNHKTDSQSIDNVTNCIDNDIVHNTTTTTAEYQRSKHRVFDLYCGIGMIGMMLVKQSPHVREVIGVDNCESAILDARHNACLNNITITTAATRTKACNNEQQQPTICFIHAKAEDIFMKPVATTTTTTNIDNNDFSNNSSCLAQQHISIPKSLSVETKDSRSSKLYVAKKEDIILLNPPRKGCDLSLLKTLLASNVRYIIYISCNPKTLARDIEILSNVQSEYKDAVYNNNIIHHLHPYLNNSGDCTSSSSYNDDDDDVGYTVRTIIPVDMFPMTTHVETVVLLERK